MTFAEAFSAADNYTSAHESRTQMHPRERFDYPDDHIEADNRLSWFLGELAQRFGDDAHYVHLRRDPEATARSYANRWPKHTMLHDSGIIGSYSHGIFHRSDWPPADRLDLARSYVATITSNIEHFLADRQRVSEAWLETLPTDVERIWHEIGATGDLDLAIDVASRPHNVQKPARSRRDRAHALARRWYGYSRSIAAHLREGRSDH